MNKIVTVWIDIPTSEPDCVEVSFWRGEVGEKLSRKYTAVTASSLNRLGKILTTYGWKQKIIPYVIQALDATMFGYTIIRGGGS